MKPLDRAGTIRIALLLAIAAFLMFHLQNFMLYYPTKTAPPQSGLDREGIRYWPAGQNGYRGFVSTAPTAGVKGTVVVFHGNAGNAADRTYYVKALVPLGFRVVLAEYPGYGARKGRPREDVFRSDARETVDMAAREFGRPVYLLGESLGSAVAAAVAKDRSAEIKALILITPWDTLLALAREKFPWLPVRLLLRDRYDNREYLRNYSGRTVIVAVERDEIIPSRHARSLYESLSGDKRIWTIRRAGHNDWLLFIDQTFWKEIMDFAGR